MSKKQKLSGTELIDDDWPTGPILNAALAVAENMQADGYGREAVLEALNQVRRSPFEFQDHPLYDTLAERLIRQEIRRSTRRRQ